nr:DNA-directed DNA polymerase [Tanacetum cinerariifolium]
MPLKLDLVYPSLDDFVDESVVEKPTVDSNEPKTIRKENRAPIIKDSMSESEEEDEPKSPSVKPNFTKIKFVKPKTNRKPIEQIRQATYKSPRENKRNCNQQMSQKLGSDFKMFNKSCHVFGSFDHLQKRVQLPSKKNSKPKGYSTNSKAFRVFHSRTRIIEENLHVKFTENTPNIAGSGPNWLFNIDVLTKSMNYNPVVVGNQSNGSTGKARVETVPDKDYILLPLWTLDLLFFSSSKYFLGDGFKPSREEEKKDPKDLGNGNSKVPSIEEPRVNQEKNAIVNSTNNINIISPTDNAAGIEDNAIDENIVYGYADDLNIPNLEEIRRFGDAEDDDSGTDMNNLDTNLQVSPVPTTRIHKDHPLKQVIGDLHSAPQIKRMSKNLEEHGLVKQIKVRQSRAKAVIAKVNSSSSTSAISSDIAELKDMVRALLLDKKNQSSAPASSPTPAPVKAVESNCVTCGVLRNIQSQGQSTQTQLANLADMMSKFMSSNMASSSGSGTLPGNTITNPKEDLKGITTRSSVAYQGPTILTPSKVVKQGTEFASTLKALIGNKEKLSKMARTPMNEHCSAVILNKLPKKLGDPDKFLIPCEFPGMDECLAVADLCASINLMPLFMWKGLSLPELTLTPSFVVVDFEPDPRVPLILGRCFLKTGRALIDVHKANKIDVTNEACEEYSQEVLSFSNVTVSGSPTPSDDLIVSTTSPTLTPFRDSDFLLFEEADAFLGLEDDPDSPELDPSYYDPEGDILMLEAILNSDLAPSLLGHEQSVPSFKNELKACEAKTIKSSVDEPPEVELKDLPPHLKYEFLEGDNKFPVIIAKELGDEEKAALIKVLKSHKRAIAWKLFDIQEVEKLLDTGLIYPISDSLWVNPVHYIPKKGGFTIVKNEENDLIPTRLVTRWRVCIDYQKLNEAIRKDHFPLSFIDQMLERLAGNEYYCFLDGFSGCMLAIFHDMVEKMMEVFVDDFLFFGNSFETYLSRLDKMLQ